MSIMKLARIARRNVTRQARRSNLLAGAMGFGVMIILLVNSFTAGVVDSVQTSLSSLLGGHVYVSGELLLDSGRTVDRITDTEAIDSTLPRIDSFVASVRTRSQTNATFIFGGWSERGSLYGVDFAAEQDLLRESEVVAGTSEAPDEQGIVLSEAVADELGVVIGERLIVSFETVTGQANVAEFSLSAVIRDGESFGLGGVGYVCRDALNPVLGLQPGEYQTLSIELNDVRSMDTVAERLEKGLSESASVDARSSQGRTSGFGPSMMFGSPAQEIQPWEGTRFSVTTLDDYMGPLTQMVTVLNAIALGLLLVLLLIIMVGLVNTFRMVLIERTAEIGTLRAMGLQRSDVQRLFLLEALFLAGRGALFALGGALVVGGVARLLRFSASGGLALMLQDGHIVLPVLPGSIVGVLTVLTIGVLLAAWLPARSAARLVPAEALRTS